MSVTNSRQRSADAKSCSRQLGKRSVRSRLWTGVAAAVVPLGVLTVPAAGASAQSLSVNPGVVDSSGAIVAVTYAMPTKIASCQFTLSGPESAHVAIPTCRPNANPQHSEILIPANPGAADETYTLTFQMTSSTGVQSSVQSSIKERGQPGLTYVALGDSFSSGEGNPVPATTWSGWVDHDGVTTGTPAANDECDRSSLAYPEVVARAMRLPKHAAWGLRSGTLVDLACSGATTRDVWGSSPATSYHLAGATGDHGEAVQLADAEGLAQAKLVTVSIGGNDVSFSALATGCLAASLAHTAKGVIGGALLVALFDAISPALGLSASAAFLKFHRRALAECSAKSDFPSIAKVYDHIHSAGFAATLEATYRAIAAAAPNARIVVVGYPNLLPDHPTARDQKRGCGSIAGSVLPYLSGIVPAMDTVIRQQAKRAGFTYVDPNAGSNSFVGHSLCDGANSWFYGINTNAAAGLLSWRGSYHPDSIGQYHLAQAVIERLQ